MKFAMFAKQEPERLVSKAEFINIMVKNGFGEKKAKMQANLSSLFGSTVKIKTETGFFYMGGR